MIMTQLIINTYVSLMYELKKNEKVFTTKFFGTGSWSYEKRIYRAAVSQNLRNTALKDAFINTILIPYKELQKNFTYPYAGYPHRLLLGLVWLFA